MNLEDQVVLWRSIPDYEGIYNVSSTGLVESIKRSGAKGGILSPHIYKGYYHVHLSKNNKIKNFGIHRLVCMAFIPTDFSQKVVNHKDGNKKNNNLNNLDGALKNTIPFMQGLF